MLKGNPQYKVVFHSEVHNISFYQPIDEGRFHASRYIAAGHQSIYASSGGTPEYFDAITGQMLTIINSGNKERIISDLSVLVNNIRYRLKHPVDEDCALRIGAIYSIMEDENPDEVLGSQTTHKIKLAKQDSKLYEFFFITALMSVPKWQGLLNDTNEIAPYLNNRMEALNSLSL